MVKIGTPCPGWRFSQGSELTGGRHEKVSRNRTGMASAALFSLGCGAAIAQNVSGGDPYTQGYAAGASAKERNSFDAFDNGYRAGQTAQNTIQSQTDSAQAYDQGYEAGITPTRQPGIARKPITKALKRAAGKTSAWWPVPSITALTPGGRVTSFGYP